MASGEDLGPREDLKIYRTNSSRFTVCGGVIRVRSQKHSVERILIIQPGHRGVVDSGNYSIEVEKLKRRGGCRMYRFGSATEKFYPSYPC